MIKNCCCFFSLRDIIIFWPKIIILPTGKLCCLKLYSLNYGIVYYCLSVIYDTAVKILKGEKILV